MRASVFSISTILLSLTIGCGNESNVGDDGETGGNINPLAERPCNAEFQEAFSPRTLREGESVNTEAPYIAEVGPVVGDDSIIVLEAPSPLGNCEDVSLVLEGVELVDSPGGASLNFEIHSLLVTPEPNAVFADVQPLLGPGLLTAKPIEPTMYVDVTGGFESGLVITIEDPGEGSMKRLQVVVTGIGFLCCD